MGGAWGAGLKLLDLQPFFESLPYIGFAMVFVGAIWLISTVRR